MLDMIASRNPAAFQTLHKRGACISQECAYFIPILGLTAFLACIALYLASRAYGWSFNPCIFAGGIGICLSLIFLRARRTLVIDTKRNLVSLRNGRKLPLDMIAGIELQLEEERLAGDALIEGDLQLNLVMKIKEGDFERICILNARSDYAMATRMARSYETLCGFKILAGHQHMRNSIF